MTESNIELAKHNVEWIEQNASDDSGQQQRMNVWRWLQGPKNGWLVTKEWLLWSEDSYTSGLRNIDIRRRRDEAREWVDFT